MSITPAIFFALLLGTLLRIPHGRAGITAWFGAIRRKLDRDTRPVTERAMRGAVVLSMAMLVATVIGQILSRLCDHLAEGRMLEIILLAALLGPAQFLHPLWRMVRAARREDWQALDAPLKSLAFGDAGAPDGHGKLRLGVWLAWQGAVSMIGSVLAFVFAGFSGVLVFYVVRILESLAEPRSPYDLVILWVARVLAAPAQMVARTLLWIAAWLASGLYRVRALRYVLYSDRTFLAALMHTSLGGPARLHGKTVNWPWVGSGSAKLSGQDSTRFALALSILLLMALMLSTLGTV